MAAKSARPGRTLIVFFVGLAIAYGLVALAGTWKPELGLDLQGGTRITLIAKGDPSAENLEQARSIIDQRVNGSGVSEAEVVTQGSRIIVVEIPGRPGATSWTPWSGRPSSGSGWWPASTSGPAQPCGSNVTSEIPTEAEPGSGRHGPTDRVRVARGVPDDAPTEEAVAVRHRQPGPRVVRATRRRRRPPIRQSAADRRADRPTPRADAHRVGGPGSRPRRPRVARVSATR